MKKNDLKNIHVEGFERFSLNGDLWTPDERCGKNRGTSPRGLWTDFRNNRGEAFRVYKNDLLEIDARAAIVLFNGPDESKSALKKKREDAGMSQAGLAAASGVDVRMIQNYEQGANRINKAAVETVLKLADALKCDVREIID